MEAISQVIHKYTNTNTSDSEVKNTNTNTRTLQEVQIIAEKLETTLGKQVPSRYEYYCKIAWKLPDHLIWNCLEAEMNNRTKGKPPHRLFSYLTAQYMKKAPSSR